MKPLVSVLCLAYNHEKYIRDALEGFVSQKTNFPFEVFVHDDASTDNTAEIIREYAEKYPEIIKPIYQTENQHSKNVRIGKTIVFPMMKGKYIAICEGDDYWCNKNKLQKQVDWLETHPDYSFCTHNTIIHNCVNGSEQLINESTLDKDIPIQEIIQWKKNLFHTSSYMYRYEYKDLPDELSIKGVGDYPRALYMATCGKVRYLSDVMSVYRYLTSDSWSMRMYNSVDSAEKKITHWGNINEMLKKLNAYTNNKYKECIDDVIRRNQFNILLCKNDLKTMKREYRDYFDTLNKKDRLRSYLSYYCPFVFQLYRKLKDKCNKE